MKLRFVVSISGLCSENAMNKMLSFAISCLNPARVLVNAQENGYLLISCLCADCVLVMKRKNGELYYFMSISRLF